MEFTGFRVKLENELNEISKSEKDKRIFDFRKYLFEIMKGRFTRKGKWKGKEGQWEYIYAAAKKNAKEAWSSGAFDHYENLEKNKASIQIAYAIHYWFHTSAEEDSATKKERLSFKEAAKSLDRILLDKKTFYELFGEHVEGNKSLNEDGLVKEKLEQENQQLENTQHGLCIAYCKSEIDNDASYYEATLDEAKDVLNIPNATRDKDLTDISTLLTWKYHLTPDVIGREGELSQLQEWLDSG